MEISDSRWQAPSAQRITIIVDTVNSEKPGAQRDGRSFSEKEWSFLIAALSAHSTQNLVAIDSDGHRQLLERTFQRTVARALSTLKHAAKSIGDNPPMAKEKSIYT